MALLNPPQIPVFPAGYGGLAQDMEGWVENSLGFQTTGVVFRAERHASQTIAASGITTFAFDTILEDPYSGWNATFNVYYVPFTGWYEITITASAGASTNTLAANIGTPEQSIFTTRLLGTSASTNLIAGSAIFSLIGDNDYIGGGIYNSGGALATATTNGQYPTMEITFVSQ